MRKIRYAVAAVAAATVMTVVGLAGFAAPANGDDSGGGGKANYYASLDQTLSFTSTDLGPVTCRYRFKITVGIGPSSINRPFSTKLAVNDDLIGMDGADGCRKSNGSQVYGTTAGKVYVLVATYVQRDDGSGFSTYFPGVAPHPAGIYDLSTTNGPAGYQEGSTGLLVSLCEVKSGGTTCSFPFQAADGTWNGWTTYP